MLKKKRIRVGFLVLATLVFLGTSARLLDFSHRDKVNYDEVDIEDFVELFMTVSFLNEATGRSRNSVVKWNSPINIYSGIVGDNHESYLREIIALLSQSTGLNIEISGTAKGSDIIIQSLSFDDIVTFTRRAKNDALNSTIRRWAVEPGSPCMFFINPSKSGEITGAGIFIKEDTPTGVIRACIAEELAQSLGLIGDSQDSSGTIFSDKSPDIELTRTDLLLLRVLYDRKIVPGMTRTEVEAMLPMIIDDITVGKGKL